MKFIPAPGLIWSKARWGAGGGRHLFRRSYTRLQTSFCRTAAAAERLQQITRLNYKHWWIAICLGVSVCGRHGWCKTNCFMTPWWFSGHVLAVNLPMTSLYSHGSSGSHLKYGNNVRMRTMDYAPDFVRGKGGLFTFLLSALGVGLCLEKSCVVT